MELHKLKGQGVEQFLNEEVFKKHSSEKALFSQNSLHAFLDRGKVKRVLIVEDDLSQKDLLEELLLEINPEVKIDWEVNADRAISRVANETAKGKSYDVVLSDIELGQDESSGMDLFQYCIEWEPSVEPILISAYSRDKLQKKHFVHTEPIDYIRKPINFEAFFKKIAPILAPV